MQNLLDSYVYSDGLLYDSVNDIVHKIITLSIDLQYEIITAIIQRDKFPEQRILRKVINKNPDLLSYPDIRQNIIKKTHLSCRDIKKIIEYEPNISVDKFMVRRFDPDMIELLISLNYNFLQDRSIFFDIYDTYREYYMTGSDFLSDSDENIFDSYNTFSKNKFIEYLFSVENVFKYMASIKTPGQLIELVLKAIKSILGDEYIIYADRYYIEEVNDIHDRFIAHLLKCMHDICGLNPLYLEKIINMIPFMFSSNMDSTILYLLEIGLSNDHIDIHINSKKKKSFNKIKLNMLSNGISTEKICTLETIYLLNPNPNAIAMS